jgi:chromate transporter
MIYLRLFYEFFYTGLFAFGGGLATIPFLQSMSGRTGWFTLSQLADMIAVSESTPGAIGVNMATYTGFTAAGVLGAVTATLGIVTPSVILVVIAARLLQKFRDSAVLNAVFSGLRPASLGLIAAAGIAVVRIAFLTDGAADYKAILLAAVLLPAVWKIKLHPIVFIAFSALIGVLFEFGA